MSKRVRGWRDRRSRRRDQAAQDAQTVAFVRRLGRLVRLVPHGRWSWDVLVWVVAALLFVISWPTYFATHDVPSSLAPALAGLGVLPVLLIRVNPPAAWALTMCAAVGVGIAFRPLPEFAFPWQPTHFIVLLATLVAVTLTSRWRHVLLVWAVTVAAVAVFMPFDLKFGWVFGVSMVTATAVLLRALLLSRRQLARQEELSELERARRAVLEERSRIARELHDVVAHRMSMVVVQAQTASRRMEGVPPHVERELDAIAEQAREALNEVRGMLGVLRSDAVMADRAPQPGLAEVERLLDGTREAGVDLRWTVTGDPAGCSEATALVVFRILQESLANASRHAAGASVVVEVTYDDAAVTLSVVNGPSPHSDVRGATAHEGTGISGMVARARSVAGELDAGPTGDGGFAVRARVPKHVGASDAAERRGAASGRTRPQN